MAAASRSGSDVDLHASDFELFGLPQRFEQDREALERRWKALQREAHPDRFAAEPAAAQRIAMQWSVRINEAYQRLKDPLRRAAYLCELNRAPIQAESNTAMPGDFLMQQMAWREALDEADDAPAVNVLLDEAAAVHRDWMSRLALALDADQDHAQAARCVRALMFIERFQHELEERLDRLET